MSSFSQVSDPTDLSRLKSVIAAAPEPERLVPLGIKQLEISWNASELLVFAAAELLREQKIEPVGAKVLLITDDVTILKGQRDFKARVNETLSKYFKVTWLVLTADGVVKVDDKSLDLASAAVPGHDLVVGLGGGTISDIAKVACHRNPGTQLVSIQTAASVDGYTDNVSVVLKNGAKRTIPSNWPEVVLADLEVIQSAPLELNLAGFGEALSLFTAPADWELASRLSLDSSFHETPRDLLLTFAGDPAEWGNGLAVGNLSAVEQLTKVLAIRGIGTGIAGTTACLSGTEHLISHMLDMRAVASGEQVGLHGAQVGVASLVSAMAWRYLLEILPELELPETVDIDWFANKAKTAFADIDKSGDLTRECISDLTKKLERFQAGHSKIAAQLKEWQINPRELAAIAPIPEALAQGLLVSGAPMTHEDLEPWVTEEIWQWSVANCHLMRNRFTAVDLLAICGRWEKSDWERVLELTDLAVAQVIA
jgi:glycerol-1-phosphate dehydrogenase [NAD(P)+]